ncbi:MAG: hypothetical protein JWN66_4984 [Sphingomonas bacterium]|uniref:hypothetical protein n=1 Tax=Sphingomonas bacterium TaxID=1895847 RepID=UPI00260D1ACC|nr:hypothetical protein [Sphingomonas bacterium]MDB5707868.1 hypothetical protein [Sphingomonas bacterium]
MTNELRVITAEPPGEGVIDLLEAALERAKKREISSIALALVDRDGCCESGWSFAPSQTILVGAISRLLHRYNLRCDE